MLFTWFVSPISIVSIEKSLLLHVILRIFKFRYWFTSISGNIFLTNICKGWSFYWAEITSYTVFSILCEHVPPFVSFNAATWTASVGMGTLLGLKTMSTHTLTVYKPFRRISRALVLLQRWPSHPGAQLLQPPSLVSRVSIFKQFLLH